MEQKERRGTRQDDVGVSRVRSLPVDYEPCHDNVALLKAELKAMANDREILRKDLNKMQQQVEVYKQLVASQSLADASPGQESSILTHNYECLKSKCDYAMNELQSMHLLHSETVRKYDHAMRDAEMFRQDLVLAKENAMGMKSQYNELLTERQRLEQELEELRRVSEEDRQEIEELRKHQRDALRENNEFEEFSMMYDAVNNRYESLKQECEGVRKQYAESVSMLNGMSGKVDTLQDENEALRKQYNEAAQKYNMSCKDRKLLQQHLTMNLQSSEDEKKVIMQEVQRVKQEKEMLEKQLKQALNDRSRASKELGKLKEEKEAAERENILIMSERNIVHREIDQLQERVIELNKLLVEEENRKKAAQEEAVRLRQALAEMRYRETRSNSLEFASEEDKVLDAFNRMLGEQVEQNMGSPSSSSGQEETFKMREWITKESGNMKEMENLRKELEKKRNELGEVVQELEESKTRCDWAFRERDKIVKERESIRTLCDKLRHERDNAVSELIGALRDSDELKRQKNDYAKELKSLQEKFESMLEKEIGRDQLNTINHSHSHDSAIDSDLQEWETEMVDLDIGNGHSGELGFELIGGPNESPFSNDGSVFVQNVQPGSVGYGKIKSNDQIVRINNIDVSSVEKTIVCQMIRNSSSPVHLVVRRRKYASSRAILPVHIYLSGNRDLGLNFEQGLYISGISIGSPAARESNLAIGDRILHVNGISLENCTAAEASRLILGCGDHIILNVLKYCPTPTSSIVSSTSMYIGQNFADSLDSYGNRSPQDRPWKNAGEDMQSIPEAARLRNNTPTEIGAKSNASQTDSLGGFHGEERQRIKQDSVSPDGARSASKGSTSSHERKTIFDKAMNAIARPFRSTIDRAARDARCKSSYPFVSTPVDSSKNKQNEQSGRSSKDQTIESEDNPAFRKKSNKSHGTWPKCRVHVNYSDSAAPVTRSTRPHLSPLIGADLGDYRLQPTDTFARSMSVKHSMQRSDPTTKYSSISQVNLMPPGGNGHMVVPLPGGNSHAVSSSDQMLLGKTFRSDEKYSNSVERNGGNVIVSSAKVDIRSKDNSVGDSGDHESSFSTQINKSQDATRYRRRQNVVLRPTPISSSAGKPTRNSMDASQLAYFSRNKDHVPLKPNTLDVQTIYSPRPLPHTWLNITPTVPRSMVPSVNSCPSPLLEPFKSLERPSSLNRSPREIDSNYSSMSAFSKPSPSALPYPGFRDPGAVHGLSTNPAYYTPPQSFGRSKCGTISESIGCDQVFKGIGTSTNSSSARSPAVQSSDTSLPFTQPYRYQERIRIPSSSSVISSSKSSTGVLSSPNSFDAISDKASNPSPYTSSHEYNRIPAGTSFSLPRMSNSGRKHRIDRTRPQLGETRTITVNKTTEPFGINIDSGSTGGIFVSSVSENSLASKVGVEIGDQLLEGLGLVRVDVLDHLPCMDDIDFAGYKLIQVCLEFPTGDFPVVCGINMRSATKPLAQMVLGQVEGPISMLVQYNPDKYLPGSDESSDEESSKAYTFTRGSSSNRARASSATITPETFSMHAASQQHSVTPSDDYASTAVPVRSISRKKLHLNDSLGLELMGGNAVGIFIKSIAPNSVLGGSKGVHVGDQILEFNGIDFRQILLEEALIETSKPVEKVNLSVSYDIVKFNQIQNQVGDSLYVRARCDHQSSCDGELSFAKGDIMYVDNTVVNGRIGVWWAYLINEDEVKTKCGTIPSRAKLEEELSHRRSLCDILEGESKSACHSSGMVRRSFFRRHKHHRNSSKESHDLTSFSDASLNSDSTHVFDEGSQFILERVEKYDGSVCRPVVIVAPFSEQIINKLTSESPDKFCSYNAGISVDLDDSEIDYRGRDGNFESISINTLKEIMKKNGCHCLLNVPVETIGKFNRCHVHPIVLFVKHKSAKQIREVKDAQFLPEKISSKLAKDFHEQNQEEERKYRHLFSDIVPGGNLAYMAFKIKTAIDVEQKKTLWIAVASGR